MNRPKATLAHRPELDGDAEPIIAVHSRHTPDQIAAIDSIAEALTAEWVRMGIRRTPSRGDAVRVAVAHYLACPPKIRERG